MKLYKNWNAAFKAANGRPVIKIDNLYIVGNINEATQIALLDGKGRWAGQITMGGLDRLGNADQAETNQPFGSTAFKKA